MQVRDWAFSILALVVAGLCLRLGLWQLARLAERRERNALIQAQLGRPPVRLTGREGDFEDLAYRRAEAQGSLDAQHQILIRNRSYNGRPGFHLVTPLLLAESERAVLVDRGWIPMESGGAPPLGRYALAGRVEIQGILRPSQPEPRWEALADPTPRPDGPPLTMWRVIHIKGIQNQTPSSLLPVYLEATAVEPGSGAAPRPNPSLDLSDGPHLGYAIQWFAFSSIALAGGGLWVRRRVAIRAAKGELA